MAKILVAFYNCMKDPENLNAMPAWSQTITQISRTCLEIYRFQSISLRWKRMKYARVLLRMRAEEKKLYCNARM